MDGAQCWGEILRLSAAHPSFLIEEGRNIVAVPGRGVLLEKLGGGVRPAFYNPHPNYISPPYLWPDEKFDTLFSDLPYNISSLVQNYDEGIVKGFC